MTGLWIIVGIIALVVTAVLVRAMVKPPAHLTGQRNEFDLNVFKDQLAEVDRDRDRGVLSDDQAAAARTEIERRILALAQEDERAEKRTDGTTRLTPTTVAIAMLVPAGAVAMYLSLGVPGLPNLPYADRDIAAERSNTAERQQAVEMNQLTDKLKARLEKDPSKIEGWLLLGRSLIALDRNAEAVDAMQKAYEIAPLDPTVIVQYAEVLIINDANTVGEKAQALLQRAVETDKRNPRARFYLALAKAQADDVEGALQGWIDLKAVSPKGAPWLVNVDQQIAAAAKDLGIDPATVTASADALALGPPPSPPMLARPAAPPAEAAPDTPGPTREDMEAAAGMSAQDRSEMIRGMVQRLADRLKENPDDLAGWKRLANAYRVLGEDAKAREAEARIKALTQ